eukprot:gnl/TRDRNA2_/TRDRNA2_88744_c0_seq1.p1 gnl/TRDRNA2_/TRDRNA2_88744_c0~~gnl/TRDRNA2_/TRDRNA2_88744_c0_seq1.p1  ORF type:complete len:399 (-),score=88.37 gnl/TRDRNA2_/TRDRNA2_88744_c0_seq1:31-1227(-)
MAVLLFTKFVVCVVSALAVEIEDETSPSDLLLHVALDVQRLFQMPMLRSSAVARAPPDPGEVATLNNERPCSKTMDMVADLNELTEVATNVSAPGSHKLRQSQWVEGLLEPEQSLQFSVPEPTFYLRWFALLMSSMVFGDILRRAGCKATAAAQQLVNEATFVQELSDAEYMWSKGCTALHTACKEQCASAAARLLKQGAATDALDDWGETPLHHAARAGAVDICELLIAHGAHVDAKSAQDWTPLIAAGSAGQRAVCEWLLAHGATNGGLEEWRLPPFLQELIRPGTEGSAAAIAMPPSADDSEHDNLLDVEMGLSAVPDEIEPSEDEEWRGADEEFEYDNVMVKTPEQATEASTMLLTVSMLEMQQRALELRLAQLQKVEMEFLALRHQGLAVEHS